MWLTNIPFYTLTAAWHLRTFSVIVQVTSMPSGPMADLLRGFGLGCFIGQICDRCLTCCSIALTDGWIRTGLAISIAPWVFLQVLITARMLWKWSMWLTIALFNALTVVAWHSEPPSVNVQGPWCHTPRLTCKGGFGLGCFVGQACVVALHVQCCITLMDGAGPAASSFRSAHGFSSSCNYQLNGPPVCFANGQPHYMWLTFWPFSTLTAIA